MLSPKNGSRIRGGEAKIIREKEFKKDKASWMGAGAHKTPCSSHCRKMVVRKSEKGMTSGW